MGRQGCVYRICHLLGGRGEHRQREYNCQLSNPNGTVGFKSDALSLVYGVLQANAAYTPSSAESFFLAGTFLQD
jgi:hypothetical protein